MTRTTLLLILSACLIVVAAIPPLVSLFGEASGEAFSFRNVWDTPTELSGRGLYRLESTFKAPINRGTDAVVLVLLLPVLLWNTLRLRRARGGSALWLQTGLLSCALYYSLLQAVEVIFNPLFLVYVTMLSLSLFAFIVGLRTVDYSRIQARMQRPFPRRGTVVFLLVAGGSVGVWLLEIITAYQMGMLPAHAGASVTMPTYAIDLAIIGPAVFIAAWELHQRRPLGYLLAIILLTLNAFIGFVVIGQTIFQYRAGILLTPQQFIPFVGVFVALSVVALWLVSRLLRSR